MVLENTEIEYFYPVRKLHWTVLICTTVRSLSYMKEETEKETHAPSPHTDTELIIYASFSSLRTFIERFSWRSCCARHLEFTKKQNSLCPQGAHSAVRKQWHINNWSTSKCLLGSRYLKCTYCWKIKNIKQGLSGFQGLTNLVHDILHRVRCEMY